MTLQHEIMNVLKNYKSVSLEYNELQKEIKIEIKKTIICISALYPMKRPTVTINNMPYQEYITPPTHDISYLIEVLHMKEKMEKCISSENRVFKKEKQQQQSIYEYSILHPLNWKSIYTISTIMKEIELVIKIKQKVTHIIGTYEIAEQFNLPFELKQYIYSYL